MGFGIQEKHFEVTEGLQEYLFRNASSVSNRVKENFRYVRDDKKGIIVMIHDLSDEGYYRIEYMEHLSSTCRLRSFGYIKCRALLNAINDSKSALDFNQIFPSVTLIQTVHEYRPCPICRKPPSDSCVCKLDLEVPKHAYDFSNGAKQMSSHIGFFQGMASWHQFAGGRICKMVKLGSQMEVRGGSVPDLVTKLMNWSITEHLKDLPDNSPLPVISCSTSATENDESDSQIQMTLPDIAPSEDIPEVHEDSFEDTAMLDRFFDPSPPNIYALQEDVIPIGPAPLELPQYDTTAYQGPDSGGIIEVEMKPFLNHEHNMPSSDQNPMGTSSTIQVGGPYVEDDMNNQAQLSQEHLAGGDYKSAGRVLSLVQELECSLERTYSKQGVSQEDDRAPLTPLAQVLDEGSRLQNKEEEEKQQLKELKQHQKRERNRAAAKRSNAKKKKENDARKLERAKLKNLEIELRAEEQRLRKENVSLRRSLHERGIPALV